MRGGVAAKPLRCLSRGPCADLGFGKMPTRLAAVVTAIAALVALLYAHLQITEGRRAEREANANELWRETLRLGFDNPKLSDPSLKLADFDYDTYD